MTPYETPQAPTEKAAIQIDAYGIKTTVQPSSTGEPPKSWKEVGHRVNCHLMRLADGLAGLPADVLDGARRLVRGLCEIPGNLAKRIERSHERAEKHEDKQQSQLESGRTAPPPPQDAITAVQDLLLEFQARGIPVQLRQLEDGRVALFLVRPENTELAAELVERALPPPVDSPTSEVHIDSVELSLSLRTKTLLVNAGIPTPQALAARSANELLALPGFGEKTLKEVREELGRHGLSLRDE